MSRLPSIRSLALWLALLMLPAGVWAIDDEELLDPDQAFAVSVEKVTGEAVHLQWNVADGYYLYRNKFKFNTDAPGIELGTAETPPGKIKQDEIFGEVETYRRQVRISLPYTGTSPASDSWRLTMVSQGCADIGVCYPPHKQYLQISGLTAMVVDKDGQALTLSATPADPTPTPSLQEQLNVSPVASSNPPPVSNPDDGALSVLTNLGRSLGLSGNNDDELLSEDQAFRFLAQTGKGGHIELDWQIADGYYLYRDKIVVSLTGPADGITLQDPQYPPAKTKQDEYFGKMAVYYGDLAVSVPYDNLSGAEKAVTVQVKYQGCAEAGLCYPPITKTASLVLPPFDPATTKRVTPTPPAPKAAGTVAVSGSAPQAEQDRLARFLLEKPLWLSALLFFALGIGLAFTPCVFPMIPILSGIIIGHGEKISTTKALSLSLVYVLAMALTYTVAGVAAGLLGTNLQAAFQDPWIVGAFATLFVLLALSMFGFYELQMPAAVQSRLTQISNSQQGGSMISAGIMGFLSALIVGPCVTAPLIGALIVIGQTGDAVLGGSALFALSLGMGAPLLIIGASAGKLLPRAGAWMEAVKAVFGIGLIAVAIWLLERIIPGPAGLFLWAMLFMVTAIYMGALDSHTHEIRGWRRFWKGVGLVMLLWGVLMAIGAATGARDMFNPLKNFTAIAGTAGSNGSKQQHLDFTRIKSVEDFETQLKQANARGQAVMLDFYADWCVYCVQMEERTFPDPRVQQALADVHLLQADVTANDDTDKALLKRFGLIAPPAILFFGADGAERKNYRVVGFQNADSFAQHVRNALN